jgi:hypothetical protein
MMLRVGHRQRFQYERVLWCIFVTKVHEGNKGCNKFHKLRAPWYFFLRKYFSGVPNKEEEMSWRFGTR